MSGNVYEGLFIFDSNRYARDPAGAAERVKQLLEKHGAEVLVSRLWEERKLAYPIKSQRKGTYWLTYFRLAGPKIVPLTEETLREDNILRHLFLKVDHRIVETLVEHAQVGKEAKPQAAEGAEEVKAAVKEEQSESADADTPAETEKEAAVE